MSVPPPLQPQQSANDLWGFPASASNISTFASASRQQHVEKTSRLALANGVPHDAPTCTLHAANTTDISTLSRQNATVPPAGSGIDNNVVLRSTRDFGVARTTALFPQCLLCFYADQTLPPGSTIPEGFDSCTCATSLLTSDCIVCALATLELNILRATGLRSRRDVNGHEILACECGSSVMLRDDAGELVRKCVGCGGVATAPWRDWHGGEVVFGWKRADVIVTEASRAESESLSAVQAGNMEGSLTVLDDSDPRLKGKPPPDEPFTVSLAKIQNSTSLVPTFSAPIEDIARQDKDTEGLLFARDSAEPQCEGIRRDDTLSWSEPIPLREITNQASQRPELNKNK